MAENTTPRLMDAVGKCSLYDEDIVVFCFDSITCWNVEIAYFIDGINAEAKVENLLFLALALIISALVIVALNKNRSLVPPPKERNFGSALAGRRGGL